MDCVINLTPHAVVLMPEGPDGPSVTLEPSGVVARCATQRVRAGEVEIAGLTVPITRTSFGRLEGLPDPQPGVLYLTSALAAQAAAASGRTDVVMVDDPVRDEAGRVIGARALALP
jgi:hypothetical protein